MSSLDDRLREIGNTRRRVDSLARVLPLAAVTGEGMAVRPDGTVLRVLALDNVPQPLGNGKEHRDEIRRTFAELSAGIGPNESIQVIVRAEPVRPEWETAPDHKITELAARDQEADGRPELAKATRRLGAAVRETVASTAAQVGGTELRWWIAVPTRVHLPAGPWSSMNDRGRAVRDRLQRTPQLRNLTPGEFLTAEQALDDAQGSVTQSLSKLGVTHRTLRGAELLALWWEWLHPGRTDVPFKLLSKLPRPVAADDESARAHRHAIVAALGHGAAIDTHRGPDGSMLRDQIHHVGTGALEQVMHLARVPHATTPWWLLAMRSEPPWTLTVHLHGTDRLRERRRARVRRRQLYGDTRRKETQGKVVDPEVEDRVTEAFDLDAELSTAGYAGVWDVSCYLSLRDDDGDAQRLARAVKRARVTMEVETDARIYPGAFLAEDSWVSTLPGAPDQAGATNRVSTRNVVDMWPLQDTNPGHTTGIPIGWSVPGWQSCRIDPWAESPVKIEAPVILVTARMGSGKTMITNLMALGWLSQGAFGAVLDRSAVEGEDGTRQAGHYEPLLSLVPGAQVVHLGARDHDVIMCPWDVPDPASPEANTIDALVAIHAHLIGDETPSGPILNGSERSTLKSAIEGTYSRAAATGVRPCESLLREVLLNPDEDEQTDADTMRVRAGLATRLRPYCAGGSGSWLLDDETTLTSDAPFVVFDLAGVPDSLSPVVTLGVMAWIGKRTELVKLRGRPTAARPWSGRSFFVAEEMWAQVGSSTGSWIPEWVRRARHRQMAVVAITQKVSDFDTKLGRDLLELAEIRLVGRSSDSDRTFLANALEWPDEAIESIRHLESEPGSWNQWYLASRAGRGVIRVQPGVLAYWMTAASPQRDQPLRADALAATDGDPWKALGLLVDVGWRNDAERRLRDFITDDDEDEFDVLAELEVEDQPGEQT